MKKRFDIVVNAGSYTDSYGGEKTRWVKIGTGLESEKGKSIKIDAIPLNWDGWASLMESKPKQELTKPTSIDLDEIPF